MVVGRPFVEVVGDVEGRRVRSGVFEIDYDDLEIVSKSRFALQPWTIANLAVS